MKKKQINNTGMEDIINHFAGFDLDNYHNQVAKEKIRLLTIELEKMKIENKKLKTKIKYLEKQNNIIPHEKFKISFEQIQNDLRNLYPELSNEGLKTLATAEHLFKNEKSNLDYSNIYSSYIKMLEIEIKKSIPSKRQSTFGALLIELKKRNNFKTFIDVLDANKIIEIRNRGVHSRTINKTECGNLRKILLEEGWLRRVLHLLIEEALEKEEGKIMKIETLIVAKEHRIKIGKVFYNTYLTSNYEYLLSESPLAIGSYSGEGKIIEIDDLEYILLS
jgi:hypothetical protein